MNQPSSAPGSGGELQLSQPPEGIVSCCPGCKGWLWTACRSGSHVGTGMMPSAARYVADDGDAVPLANPPAPFRSWQQVDAELLTGTCPHCSAGYWFVDVRFATAALASERHHLSWSDDLCHETPLTAVWLARGLDGAGSWSISRIVAGGHDEAAVTVDCHVIGPFAEDAEIAGALGVSSCHEAASNAFSLAAGLVEGLAPLAARHLGLAETA